MDEIERKARELPSAETLSSILWRDWMTTEQADALGRDMHGWLQAHAEMIAAQERSGALPDAGAPHA